MCELLGMSASVPTDIRFSFSALSQRGGATGPHKDGWGICFYEQKGCRSIQTPLTINLSDTTFRYFKPLDEDHRQGLV